MGTPSAAMYSTKYNRGFQFSSKISARHFNKHLAYQRKPSVSLPSSAVNLSNFSGFSLNSANIRRAHVLQPINCAFAENPTSNFQPQVLLQNFRNLSFDSVKGGLSELTPIGVCKWVGIAAFAIAAAKWAVNLVLNPFVWMYFSWTWLFWPWFVAIGLGVYGIYCFRKHSRCEASIVEQLAIVTSAFTWLTLVPPAYFNGFLEGWPYVFFFVYHYFFFFNVSIRKRLYGDYNMRPHDPKWDVSVPNWYQVLFGVGVMVGHWLAAFEGPELHLIPGGWSNIGIWGLIMATLFMHYNASLYLAKYSEKIVVPTSVVQFGPYRWVRHPIYASTMLLFLTYFVALRAPLSCLYTIGVCIMYYDQKAKLEEELMADTFRESYLEYMSKVRYKFIPFVY
ncbi:hypothetical protein SOVF_075600 [Spinacia oleracea]|uniref:Protein-S-isoprenylcysteine O-methyltransferase n=1 Tax=Spinacia oleracea TaxID=3562 RepID=A0A9R0JFW3_SPIOL|nr:uncharacterized protein LOC110806001 [Spinacia oleracea]KNA17899.1 hypothetical protein SOVF_075600 [Spinacia oleracea]